MTTIREYTRNRLLWGNYKNSSWGENLFQKTFKKIYKNALKKKDNNSFKSEVLGYNLQKSHYIFILLDHYKENPLMMKFYSK